MSISPEVTFSGEVDIDGARLFARLHLKLKSSQWTILLGSSGVGKSTILRLIAGLQTQAVFSGEITASDGGEIAGRVAYMAQQDLLMPWATVMGNITLGSRLRGQKPDQEFLSELLHRVQLTEHAHKKPAELSGGQRQRVALARTLIENKQIILLDEPFSALDAKTRSEMQELAVELLQNKTVLLVTHDPAEAARLGHSIVVMHPSGLMQCEPPKGAIPRPIDDLETLESQGALLQLLRRGKP